MVSRSMHSKISDSNENDTPASARDALTHAHTETAAETDANTKTVTRVQTGGSNAPPIARDETRKARSGGAAGRRQGFRKTEVNTRTAWNLPVVAAAGSVSKKYRLWDLRRVVLCGVVGLLLGTTVFTSVRRSANEATPSPTAAQLITADGAQLSQVLGTQASIALAPAVEEQLRALLSTAPALEPKLPPSSGQSTQIAAAQDRPQQRSASEAAGPRAVEVSAIGESQGPPQRERSTARQLNSDEITALISRGSDFLKIGDFSAARILLQRGAESGSADAALMLGKTFDPLFLHEIGAIGIKADVARCRQWYQKAVELGSETAAQRLANLAQTGQ